MISDDNGCMCHAIQARGQPRKQCQSCLVRAESTTHCTRCSVGLFLANDTEASSGLCSNCFYEGGHGRSAS